MGAITDLWKSERGLLAVLIIIAASVLAGLDKMAVAEWQTFVMGIFIAYAAGKTVTGAVAILKDGQLRTAAISALEASGISTQAKNAAVSEVAGISEQTEAKS